MNKEIDEMEGSNINLKLTNFGITYYRKTFVKFFVEMSTLGNLQKKLGQNSGFT